MVFSTVKMKKINRAIISLIIGILYAITDELHQFFIPGRGPLVSDVILDGIGVLVGILFGLLLIQIYKNVALKRKARS